MSKNSEVYARTLEHVVAAMESGIAPWVRPWSDVKGGAIPHNAVTGRPYSGGNVLAFFELPTAPTMGRDGNTPEWVQHIAFQVGSVDELLATKLRLQKAGIDVIGPTDHTLFQSIYFFDPNGHRVELAADTATPEMQQRLDAVKWAMLEEWSRTKRAPKHAAWMHEKELGGGAATA